MGGFAPAAVSAAPHCGHCPKPAPRREASCCFMSAGTAALVPPAVSSPVLVLASVIPAFAAPPRVLPAPPTSRVSSHPPPGSLQSVFVESLRGPRPPPTLLV